MDKKDNIKIDNHRGTWYVISESEYFELGKVYLLEHEQYGDEVAGIIVNEDCKVILEDVLNGWDDLEYVLTEGGM